MNKQTEIPSTQNNLDFTQTLLKHKEKQVVQLQELWTLWTPAGEKARIYSVFQFKQSMRSELRDRVVALYYHYDAIQGQTCTEISV